MSRFHSLWPLVVAFSAACAPRSVPERFPVESAASDVAAPGPLAAVTVALREDPPLPGEPSEGWAGLEAYPSGSPAHHHEHGEHANDERSSQQPSDRTDGEPADGERTVDVIYVCPMHSDVTSKEPGKCPRCGMNLVPQK